MNVPPDKQQASRLLEMCRSGLVTWRELQPWTTLQIEQLDKPPAWLCELVTKTYHGHIEQCIAEYAHSAPFEDFDRDALADLHIACLLLRHQRRELSWATFLQRAGEHADCCNEGREGCETFFELLNELEIAEFDAALEAQQRAGIETLYADALEIARRDHEPLRQAFRAARDA
ncbi:MAG: hypothetical protein R3F29_15335 [Planctomycetota bacterium]